MTENIRLLFVDDEERILDGLKRKLHPLRHSWKMDFALGGEAAIKFLESNPYDVVITDMRMPGISGLDLLNYIQDHHPATLRFVLSGQSDKDVILHSTKIAHRYLTKPTSIEDIMIAIDRSMILQGILKNEKLIRLGNSLTTIPAIPRVYDQIMHEMHAQEISIKNIGHIIEQDPGMSAKILQIVNSSFFGVASHIESPSRAIIMLGLDIVRSLILSIHLFDAFRERNSDPVYLNHIQAHSMKTGEYAFKIAKVLKLKQKEIDYAFMAGLLHDVGQLILASEYPEEYAGLRKQAFEEKKPLTNYELDTYHSGHAELGGYVLCLWGLPELIIEAVTFHHSPSVLSQSTPVPLTCVHLADVFDHRDHPERYCQERLQFDEGILKMINEDGMKQLESAVRS